MNREIAVYIKRLIEIIWNTFYQVILIWMGKTKSHQMLNQKFTIKNDYNKAIKNKTTMKTIKQ